MSTDLLKLLDLLTGEEYTPEKEQMIRETLSEHELNPRDPVHPEEEALAIEMHYYLSRCKSPLTANHIKWCYLVAQPRLKK
ncbi:hypothetical protein C9928_05580 [Pseudidiomarina aestuarii]|uniref:Uncharacterized protein n=1 Tax=Pseudidiomarina aestuarii TaxID=624146 RepID=A0A6N4DBL8_9GAMM|nr:hypothetical protein C9928_05580 [Pseudidiomarina aestuarii]